MIPGLSRAGSSLLILLTLVNLMNYLDRYIVAALVESLRKSELQLTDAQAGLLMTSFLLVYTLSSPYFGRVADTGNRPRVMAVGVGLWSIATALAAFAQSFHSLLATRALVGVGEAAYGTIAPTLIVDSTPKNRHGIAFAIFYLAIPVGSALGYVCGGLMDVHFGWRAAFLLAGIPGMILAFLIWRLADSQKPNLSSRPKNQKHSILRDYKFLLFLRRYRNLVLGYTFNTFAMGALAFWMPAFLERELGMDRQSATSSFGAVVVMTGIIGTFSGGWLSDRLSKRTPNGPIWVAGLSCLLGAPLVALILRSDPLIPFWFGMIAAQLLVFMSTGPVNLALISAAPEGLRGAGLALSILMIHLLGDVPSPPLVGWLSDHYGLELALQIIPFALGLGSIFWVYEALKASPAAQRADAVVH